MNWINIKEKLPDKAGQYLCFTTSQKIVIRGFSSWTTGSRLRFWGTNGSEAKNITHWMELPNPPK